METLTIVGQTPGHRPIEAVFSPDKGMNMVSLKIGGHQLIDQSTKPLFDERAAGLGALIGPHFHHRPPEAIVPLKDPSLFPHLAVLRERGITEPFSHGIARYVPWKVVHVTTSSITAELSGSMNYRGVLIKELQGFDFQMTFKAAISEKGISIDLQISGEKPSVVGLHYYYLLKDNQGIVSSQVASALRDKALPAELIYNENTQRMTYNCDKPCDWGFIPYPHAKMGWVDFRTGGLKAVVRYVAPADSSWQMWRPEGASFVCIEPLSTRDPRHPTARVNGLMACIEVEER